MNNKIQKLETKKLDIQDLGLDKIKNFFELSENDLAKIDKEVVRNLFNMARLGMQFEREMNISQRSSELNHLRIAKIVNESKSEMRKYIKRTLPHYLR